MYRHKRLKRLFQYTLLAGSIFSASIYANEINIQIKIGTFSRILKINTENLSEYSFERDATIGNPDVIDFAEPLGSEATLPTSPPSGKSTMKYRYPNLPLIELIVALQNVPAYPHSRESENDNDISFHAANLRSLKFHQPRNLKMTELYPWESDRWGFPEFHEGQRLFHLSFQLPFFSIIPLNRVRDPVRLTDEYFSVSFHILFTDNTLTRLRIVYSPERGSREQYLYTLDNNNWLMAYSSLPNLHFQNFLQRLYQGARQLALYLPMIFAQLHNRLFTNPAPPVMDEGTENSTLEHQPDNALQVPRADVSMPPSASSL